MGGKQSRDKMAETRTDNLDPQWGSQSFSQITGCLCMGGGGDDD